MLHAFSFVRAAGMSTQVEVQDVDELQKILADVRSDRAGVERTSWLIVGHVDNDPNRVAVQHHDTSATASLEDLRCHLLHDQVMYCLLRLSSTFDMSTTVKFVYVHWYAARSRFSFLVVRCASAEALRSLGHSDCCIVVCKILLILFKHDRCI